jgi:NAD(P)-dependent dehydrogenase (short-subunit alcohol dehydrogenase family)
MAAMSEFDGQVAIVTGAAGGVGREVVRLLHAAGASVVAEDLNPAVADLETDDGRIVAVQGDVAEPRRRTPRSPRPSIASAGSTSSSTTRRASS